LAAFENVRSIKDKRKGGVGRAAVRRSGTGSKPPLSIVRIGKAFFTLSLKIFLKMEKLAP
jgi:hypothetical protein